jgi:serine/threonine protein kinase
MNNLVGQHLGKYAFQKFLGHGGTGDVYKAWDEGLRRHVAIKVLDTGLLADQESVRVFRATAAVAADLHHANIVTMHDVGEQHGLHYIVMTYLRGVTLDVWLRKNKRMTIHQAARIVRQLGDALTYAHKRGVIHCDIKPSNIMLSKDGHVTILDFGMAQTRRAGRNLKNTGATPAYMSPDQALSRSLDARTDVYSLGVVLYELLSGQVPFVRIEPAATAFAHVSESPHPIKDVPDAVNQVVLKALEKSPEKRFQSAAELADAFEKAVGQEAQSLQLPLALIGAAVVLIIVALVFISLRITEPPPPTPTPVQTAGAPTTEAPTEAITNPVTGKETPTPATKTPSPTPGITATLAPLPVTKTPLPPIVEQTPPATTTPTPTQFPIPAPRPVAPGGGATVRGRTTFRWTYDGPPLADNQAFEVRIVWDLRSPDHNGAASPVRATDITIDLDQVNVVRAHGVGPYYWTVAVIQVEPYAAIGPEAPLQRFMVNVNSENRN